MTSASNTLQLQPLSTAVSIHLRRHVDFEFPGETSQVRRTPLSIVNAAVRHLAALPTALGLAAKVRFR